MLDERELLILSELRKNSRQSLTEISRRTNIPVSTIFDKVLKLNKIIIKRNISLLDFDKIGHLKVSFIVHCGKKDIKEFLLNHANVNSAYRVNKSENFFVECLFKNLYEVEMFKDKLHEMEVKNLQEHYIIEDIKREEFLTKKEHIKLVKDKEE